MSNLIRYIIQEGPEKQMKKNELDYAKYSTSWAPIQKQSQEDKYKGYKFSSKNLLENSFNSLTSNKSSQSKDEGSFMGGISNIFNNIKSDTKSSSNTHLPQSIAKTAAEESSKIGNVLSPKSIGNDNASYKIAQNNKPNIANDAKIPTNKDLSDDELIETMYPIIKEHENAKPFPYYDTRWNKTVGNGNNINNKKDFYGTNWSADNMPANKQDIDSCLENLEKIATSYEGVNNAFAIQAGREIRVLVNPEQVDDLSCIKIARDIRDQIEEELTYPGQIKVNVIREIRAQELAK